MNNKEKALEAVFEKYCEEKAECESLTIQQFLDKYIKSNSNLEDDIYSKYVKANILEGVDYLKVKKMLLLELIKRDASKPKNIEDDAHIEIIKNTLLFNESKYKKYFFLYDKSVFLEPWNLFKEFAMPFFLYYQTNIDFNDIRKFYYDDAIKQNKKLLQLYKTFFNLSDEDFIVDYDYWMQKLSKYLDQIPSEWRLKVNDSNDSETANRIIDVCETFDFKRIETFIEDIDDLNIAYNGKRIVNHIYDKYDQFVNYLNSDHINFEYLGLVYMLKYAYARMIDIMYTHLEKLTERCIKNSKVLIYVSSKANFCNSQSFNFEKFDDLSDYFEQFQQVKLPEHIILDAFIRRKNGSNHGHLRFYPRDSRIKTPWDKKSKYVFGAEVEDYVSNTKSRLIPNLYDTLVVPFTEQGIWEAFLLFFCANINYDIKNEEYNEDYYSAQSTNGIKKAARFYGACCDDILPKLSFVNEETAEIEVLMYLPRKLYERWTFKVRKIGEHVRFNKPKIRQLWKVN